MVKGFHPHPNPALQSAPGLIEPFYISRISSHLICRGTFTCITTFHLRCLISVVLSQSHPGCVHRRFCSALSLILAVIRSET